MTSLIVNHVLVLWLWGFVLIGCGSATKVWLDDHSKYQNMVVAVHPALASVNCTELFTNLQVRFNKFFN